MSTEHPSFRTRLRDYLLRPSSRYSLLTLIVVGLIIGAGGVLGSAYAIHATGTSEFCATTCHARGGMAIPGKEWMQSVHYSNPTGIRAGCSDCHIPHNYPAMLIRKAEAGANDAYHTALGTIATSKEYEANRWQMASAEWERMRSTDSAECRSCHNFTPEVLDRQAEDNKIAAKIHRARKAQGQTCVDCHKGIAHTAPEEPTANGSAPSGQPADAR